MQNIYCFDKNGPGGLFLSNVKYPWYLAKMDPLLFYVIRKSFCLVSGIFQVFIYYLNLMKIEFWNIFLIIPNVVSANSFYFSTEVDTVEYETITSYINSK